MNIKRLAAFLLIVIVTLGVVAWSSPGLLAKVRLGLDLKGGFEILYVAEPIEAGKEVTRDSLIQTAQSLEKRANASGVAEPDVTTEGTNRIRVKLAGVENQEQVRELLRKPAELSFRGPDGKKEMIGSDFVEGAAKVGFDTANRPLIQIEVIDKDKFADVTRRLLGQPLAIYLDEQQLSAPIVQSVLPDGKATITGNYTFEEATELKDIINLGALPLKLTEKYTQSIGATLGLQSLEQTVKAGVIGSLLILVFMVAFYRVPGIVAAITLIAYTWLVLVVFYLMNATLTLPGIAALILGIGMAVDANIIKFERIKEEIRSGKSLLSSLKSGSKHSIRTIMDANITNIISGGVLYAIGNGAIKGFALTMIVSILISMLTNILFSKFLIDLLIRSNLFKKPTYFGVKEADIRDL
ncbi:protein translocase subunit SecD [Paenibacillus mesophilus]|uniref:protein translocase subunit SecD n=1 Tax=Paenibacillus mesophilus TaxID=2582849 RepID=UPI00110E3868|nr:protein translocase subunit SecD [Paenibacillus mesophilus]TMV52885.1 protein translocase subunit SecD [Paenibacillus mesophilus]